MRFIIYVSLLLMVVPIVCMRPFFGLCVYYVVSILQPKMLCWRGEFQDALIVGIPFVIGAVAFGVKRSQVLPERDAVTGKIKSVVTRLTRSPLFEPSWPIVAAVLLVGYIGLGRLFSAYPMQDTSYQFRGLCKVVFVMILLTGLVSDSRRFRILFLIVALSGAFWAIKGGLKVIILGPHQVYGKTYDNNLFALTSVMTLPMVFYFGLTIKHARWRTLLLVCSALMCIGIIGSRSRAGFVAFGVVLACMAWSSRYRLRAVFAVLLVVSATLAMSGKEMRDRIESIVSYRQDTSASSRFYTWQVARTLFGEHPVLGVGFNNFEIAKGERFGGRKAAHNIYLQNASELGLIGHPLWLAIVFGTTLSLYRFMRKARRLPPEMRWAYYCSRGLLLGMTAFCIHGMFHNEEYFELMFAMVGLNVAIQVVVRRELAAQRLSALVAARPKEAEPKRKRPRRDEGHPGRLFDRPRTLSALLTR